LLIGYLTIPPIGNARGLFIDHSEWSNDMFVKKLVLFDETNEPAFRNFTGGPHKYYFDIRHSANGEPYIIIHEKNTAKEASGKMILYKEDFAKFMTGLDEAQQYVRNELHIPTPSPNPHKPKPVKKSKTYMVRPSTKTGYYVRNRRTSNKRQ
jgi:hypothetical protein